MANAKKCDICGKIDDQKDCGRVTKVKCKSILKKRILRGFKKSMRQKIKAESEGDE